MAPKRAHTAVGLVRATLDRAYDFAGAFIGARKQRADHDGIGPRSNRLGEIARILDPAVGNTWDARRLRQSSACFQYSR